MLIFTETSPWGKLWTQIMKVADTNHLSTSRCLRQSPWQVRDPFVSLQWDIVHYAARQKLATLSRTQITKVCNTNHESRGYDMCRGLSWFVSATFPAGKFQWKLQSRRNGIWALHHLLATLLLVMCYTLHQFRHCHIRRATVISRFHQLLRQHLMWMCLSGWLKCAVLATLLHYCCWLCQCHSMCHQQLSSAAATSSTFGVVVIKPLTYMFPVITPLLLLLMMMMNSSCVQQRLTSTETTQWALP